MGDLIRPEELLLLTVHGKDSSVIEFRKSPVDSVLIILSDYPHVACGLGCEQLQAADLREKVIVGPDHLCDLVLVLCQAQIDVVMDIKAISPEL